MRQVVKSSPKDFTYLKFQPGDGTLYTAIYGIPNQYDSDNLYLAIGSGDGITGGYFFRASSAKEMLADLQKAIEKKTNLNVWARAYPWTQYIRTHLRNTHEWTAIVACLLVVVLFFGSERPVPTDEDLRLIEYVYRNMPDRVMALVRKWDATLEPA